MGDYGINMEGFARALKWFDIRLGVISCYALVAARISVPRVSETVIASAQRAWRGKVKPISSFQTQGMAKL